MTYQEWLDNIALLNNKQINIEILEKLEKADTNANIEELLIPKLEQLITNKTNKTIKEIISSLEIIFNDINKLDYALVKLKKEISYIVRIIKLKQIPNSNQQRILSQFKTDINEIYKILKKEANVLDYTGAYENIIKNNEYKWSD